MLQSASVLCFDNSLRLDVLDLDIKVGNGVLEGDVKRLRDLFVCRKEQLVNFHGHHCRAFSSEHSGLELLEDGTVDDLRVVRLKRLVFFDLHEVVEQALNVSHQVVIEFSDLSLRLHDLLNLIFLEVLLEVELRGHDLVPHGHCAHGERQREVDQEHC